jgi:hypothetical protein
MEFRQKLDSLAEELLKELEKRKNNGWMVKLLNW